MARNMRFYPNVAGYRLLMKDGAMQSAINGAAERMAAMATGMCSPDTMDREPFKAIHGVDEVAAWAAVFTNSPHGRYAQNKNKVLTKAFRSVKV